MRLPRRPRSTARRAAVAAIALVAAVAGSVLVAGPASGYAGAPWFEPSKPYDQNFPDPSVFYENGTYYAYATGTGGSYLPVMTSTDQMTWIAREAYDPCCNLLQRYPGFNDALPDVASWGVRDSGTQHMTSWVTAPGVAKFGSNYNAYYGLWYQRPDRFCISVAVSTSGPKGPFWDRTTRPLVCQAGDAPGSIDPSPFIDPRTGRKYLYWAGEDTNGLPPTRLWVQELSADGLSLQGPVNSLATTTQGWEGPMIENPSMTYYAGRYLLFYSANQWWTDRYATGYAVCSGPLGPCSKPRTTPLLRSNGIWQGPGGASAFLDARGNLKLAYQRWNAPYVGYPSFPACDTDGDGKCTDQGQRRMSIAQISDAGDDLQLGAVAPGASSSTSGRTWVAERDPSDGSIVVSAVAADGTRSNRLDLNGWFAGEPAIAASAGGYLAVVAKGGDGAVWVNTRFTETGPWTGWGSIGGDVGGSPAAASWAPGRLDVFVRGKDGAMWTKSQFSPGNWSDWRSHGGIFDVGTKPALAAAGPNRLFLAAVGRDNAVYVERWNGSSWSNWQWVAGQLNGNVGAASPQPDQVVLVGRNGDDSAVANTLWMTADGVGGTGWGSLGGVEIQSSPAVSATVGSGRTDAIVVGVDGNYWRRTQPQLGQPWTPWARVN